MFIRARIKGLDAHAEDEVYQKRYLSLQRLQVDRHLMRSALIMTLMFLVELFF